MAAKSDSVAQADSKTILTVREVAERLGEARSTIHDWLKKPEFQGTWGQPGRRKLIFLERFLEAIRRTGGTDAA
ncbi:MAG: helix-turn-helix transcriptional regulator [Phycisphaerae bacterium]